MIYERIKELCKKNGISVNELEKRLNYSRGYLCKIDKHKPSHETLEMIADELNSSITYLVKGESFDFSIESEKQQEELLLLDKRIKEYAIKLSKLSEDDREDIMKMIDKFGRRGGCV